VIAQFELSERRKVAGMINVVLGCRVAQASKVSATIFALRGPWNTTRGSTGISGGGATSLRPGGFAARASASYSSTISGIHCYRQRNHADAR